MPRVKFLETRKVKDAEGRVFEADKTYTMSDASARHWENRGVAVVVDDEPQAKQAKSEPEPKPEPKDEPKSKGSK